MRPPSGLRLRELQERGVCDGCARMGLEAIIPLQLLTHAQPTLEMELRTCGLPCINLEFLKVGGGPGWWVHAACHLYSTACPGAPVAHA